MNLLQAINENISGSFYNMNESVQSEVAEKVLDKVFSMTIGKYNKINFADIEKTRGDITKLKFYKNLEECINTLKEIHKVTNKLEILPTIELAIQNIIKLKPNFEKSFRVQNNCGIMIYNLITYAIMETTSYVIATSINFLSEDEIIISDVNANDVLVDSLNRFNKLSADGSIYKFISEAEKEVLTEGIGFNVARFIKNYKGSVLNKMTEESVAGKPITKGKLAIGIGVGLIVLMAVIVPVVRNIAYFIYNTKHKISETAEVQANMLELNIKILVDKGVEPKIIARQQKWVDRFKKIAEKFALDTEKAEHNTKNEIREDKVDINSIVF